MEVPRKCPALFHLTSLNLTHRDIYRASLDLTIKRAPEPHHISAASYHKLTYSFTPTTAIAEAFLFPKPSMTTKTLCRACHRAARTTTTTTTASLAAARSNSTRDLSRPRTRLFTTETFPQSTARGGSSKLSPPPQLDPSSILSTPTWSVRSLLPPSSTSEISPEEGEINPQTLAHLSRLSALPLPSASDPASTSRLLSPLHSHLHFVRSIQSVDTTDPSSHEGKELAPLSSIRDESPEGLAEITLDLKTLEGVLADEDIVGHCRRPRRRKTEEKTKNEVEDWDVLGSAEQKVGRYFVVRSGKKGEQMT